MKVICSLSSSPVVYGLLDGNVVLFLGEFCNNVCGCHGYECGYIVVFCPETSLPEGHLGGYSEIYDAYIAIGEANTEMEITKAFHCHKYAQKGGMAEFRKKRGEGEDHIIQWRLRDDPKLSRLCYHDFDPQRVFISV